MNENASSSSSIASLVIQNPEKTMSKTDKLILKYVVKGMHPWSTMDQVEFRELVTGITPQTAIRCKLKNYISILHLGLNPEAKIMSRKQGRADGGT